MNQPYPGSQEAVDQGCKCPVMDNFYGKGIPVKDDKDNVRTAYWMSADCPLHGVQELKKAADQEG